MRGALLLVLLFLATYVNAQNDRWAVGAQQAAIGFSNQTTSSPFSSFNNQAGLAQIEAFSAGIYFENRFLVDGINLFGLAAALPTNSGTFGIGLHRYGNNAYSENKVKLAYGRKLVEKLDIGAEFEVGNIQVEEYGSVFTITFGLGAQFNILDNVRLGAHLYNPIRFKLTDDDRDRLPTLISLGAQYMPSDKVAIYLETQKNLDYRASFKGGVDYQLIKVLSIRAGFHTNPNMATFGLGLNLKPVLIDFAGTFHPQLGYAPHLGITYKGKKKENSATQPKDL